MPKVMAAEKRIIRKDGLPEREDCRLDADRKESTKVIAAFE